MSKVYLLEHSYVYGEESDFDEAKTLGVYSTRELAEEARGRYATLPGFRDLPLDCFYISLYTLDEDAFISFGGKTIHTSAGPGKVLPLVCKGLIPAIC